MSRAIVPSAADLTGPHNVTQARHELHRAIDFGDEAEQAAWARKWGESALACGERVSTAEEEDDWPFAGNVSDLITQALERSGVLKQALAAETPDIAAVRAAETRLRTTLHNIEDLLENDA